MGLFPYFAAPRELSPADHIDATASQGDTARPGVAEQMLADAGLEFAGRGTAEVINELPDLDLRVRALTAAGPSWPALHHAGYDQFAKAMREALRPLCVKGPGQQPASGPRTDGGAQDGAGSHTRSHQTCSSVTSLSSQQRGSRPAGPIAVTGCADGAARPYSQLSVGRAAAEYGAMARASAAAVLCSAVMWALHCGYDRGHAPGGRNG